LLCNVVTSQAIGANDLRSVRWPEGTQVLRLEDIDGAILVEATLRFADRDTSGPMLLDTGAGYLAVDLALARAMGLADSSAVGEPVGLAQRPLRRLELGTLQMDQVSPVLTVDAGIIRRVTGRPVLGLLGQALVRDRVLVVDYRSGDLVILPPGTVAAPGRSGLPESVLSPSAIAVPFRLAGDGKVIVVVRVTGRPGQRPTELNLIVDTGATKTTLFRQAIDRRLPAWRSWPRLRGLGAPTFSGDAAAEMVRVPRLEIGPREGGLGRSGMDAAVIDGDLPATLATVIEGPADGLLGYSFLKHFRVVLDYPRRVIWLDPRHGDVPDRPWEYSHPGIQLESVGGSVRVMSVAVGSPAARSGVRKGDELLAVDGHRVVAEDLLEVGRRLEGRPGTEVVLKLRRGRREWSVRMLRAPLL
jgi:hypothetical protein